MKLGYAGSALMFAAMIGAVTAAYFGFRANAIAAVWVAYILARPRGASFGGWLAHRWRMADWAGDEWHPRSFRGRNSAAGAVCRSAA